MVEKGHSAVWPMLGGGRMEAGRPVRRPRQQLASPTTFFLSQVLPPGHRTPAMSAAVAEESLVCSLCQERPLITYLCSKHLLQAPSATKPHLHKAPTLVKLGHTHPWTLKLRLPAHHPGTGFRGPPAPPHVTKSRQRHRPTPSHVVPRTPVSASTRGPASCQDLARVPTCPLGYHLALTPGL